MNLRLAARSSLGEDLRGEFASSTRRSPVAEDEEAKEVRGPASTGLRALEWTDLRSRSRASGVCRRQDAGPCQPASAAAPTRRDAHHHGVHLEAGRLCVVGEKESFPGRTAAPTAPPTRSPGPAEASRTEPLPPESPSSQLPDLVIPAHSPLRCRRGRNPYRHDDRRSGPLPPGEPMRVAITPLDVMTKR